jgi:hypothetical protein
MGSQFFFFFGRISAACERVVNKNGSRTGRIRQLPQSYAAVTELCQTDTGTEPWLRRNQYSAKCAVNKDRCGAVSDRYLQTQLLPQILT